MPLVHAADRLADLVGILGRVPVLWRAVACHDAAERTAVRLLATRDVEVWVLGWSPGQALELHDHGRSAGAFTVVDGRLVEAVVDTDGPLVERELHVGTVRAVPAGVVHAIAGAGDGGATSIHAYSPPLTTMTHYADDGRTALRVEHVWPEVPALAPAEGAALVAAAGLAGASVPVS